MGIAVSLGPTGPLHRGGGDPQTPEATQPPVMAKTAQVSSVEEPEGMQMSPPQASADHDPGHLWAAFYTQTLPSLSGRAPEPLLKGITPPGLDSALSSLAGVSPRQPIMLPAVRYRKEHVIQASQPKQASG